MPKWWLLYTEVFSETDNKTSLTQSKYPMKTPDRNTDMNRNTSVGRLQSSTMKHIIDENRQNSMQNRHIRPGWYWEPFLSIANASCQCWCQCPCPVLEPILMLMLMLMSILMLILVTCFNFHRSRSADITWFFEVEMVQVHLEVRSIWTDAGRSSTVAAARFNNVGIYNSHRVQHNVGSCSCRQVQQHLHLQQLLGSTTSTAAPATRFNNVGIYNRYRVEQRRQMQQPLCSTTLWTATIATFNNSWAATAAAFNTIGSYYSLHVQQRRYCNSHHVQQRQQLQQPLGSTTAAAGFSNVGICSSWLIQQCWHLNSCNILQPCEPGLSEHLHLK